MEALHLSERRLIAKFLNDTLRRAHFHHCRAQLENEHKPCSQLYYPGTGILSHYIRISQSKVYEIREPPTNTGYTIVVLYENEEAQCHWDDSSGQWQKYHFIDHNLTSSMA